MNNLYIKSQQINENTFIIWNAMSDKRFRYLLVVKRRRFHWSPIQKMVLLKPIHWCKRIRSYNNHQLPNCHNNHQFALCHRHHTTPTTCLEIVQKWALGCTTDYTNSDLLEDIVRLVSENKEKYFLWPINHIDMKFLADYLLKLRVLIL